FGYSFVAFSSLAIAVFGFLVWAHHLFVAGISPYSALIFSFLSFAVAIPSAVKTFNWTATLYKGAIWLKTPMVFVLGFMGLFLVGYLGMPRRYHVYPPEFQTLNVLSSAGASILAVGYLLPVFYFLYSLKYGEPAGANPWKATGLEWTTQSPPLPENFTVTPVV